ncbi:MAG TPA: hypothetical protein EYH14_01000 [Euryarchaeota archaeon]|nr:hypothetical protein [Euryarchaeota archaeon]
MKEITAIVKGGVIIPTTPVKDLEGKKILVRIIKQESTDPEKMYAYVRLLKEGVDAEEYFEV